MLRNTRNTPREQCAHEVSEDHEEEEHDPDASDALLPSSDTVVVFGVFLAAVHLTDYLKAWLLVGAAGPPLAKPCLGLMCLAYFALTPTAGLRAAVHGVRNHSCNGIRLALLLGALATWSHWWPALRAWHAALVLLLAHCTVERIERDRLCHTCSS